MRRMRPVAVAVTTLLLSAATAGAVTGLEPEPTPPPLGPPLIHQDPVGDVAGGSGPDFVACGVSEPWESLVSFTFEFAAEPPLSYDLETWSTDELFVAVSPRADADFLKGDFEYALIVHGATLPSDAETGSGLYDSTRAEGDEVYWRVVDIAVDGSTLTLSVDKKLIGDPDTVYFMAGASREGQEETEVYDVCPDEEVGPLAYELVGG